MDVTIDHSPDGTVLEVPKAPSPVDIDVTLPVPKPRPPPAPTAPRPSARPSLPPRPPAPTAPREHVRDTFLAFANPRKIMPDAPQRLAHRPQRPGVPIGGDEDESLDSELESVPDDDEDEGPGSVENAPSYIEEADDEYEDEDELKPSTGFKTIEEERASILFKLFRLKRDGIPVPKSITMDADIRELRRVLLHITEQMRLDESIAFQRKMLNSFVTIVEYGNKTWDPFDLQLDGWSEHTRENIHDYDGVFERLHEKYKSRVQMPPEIELVMMLLMSAVTFHTGKIISKRIAMAVESGAGGDMGGLMGMMSSLFGNRPGAAPPPPPAQTEQQQQQQQHRDEQPAPGDRHQMRGPAFDLGSILGGGGGLPFPAISNPPRDPVAAFPSPAPPIRGTKRAAPTPIPTIPEEEDRLSDALSDGPLESVPDDLTSLGSDRDTITVGAGRGRKRAKSGSKTTVKIT